MDNMEKYKSIIMDLLIENRGLRDFSKTNEELSRDLAIKKQEISDLSNLITRNEVYHQQNLMSSVGLSNSLKKKTKILEIKVNQLSNENIRLNSDIEALRALNPTKQN